MDVRVWKGKRATRYHFWIIMQKYYLKDKKFQLKTFDFDHQGAVGPQGEKGAAGDKGDVVSIPSLAQHCLQCDWIMTMWCGVTGRAW